VLFDQARRYQSLVVVHREPRMQRKDDEHKAIMKATLERNAERAAQLVEQHVRRTADAVLKELSKLGVSKDDSAAPESKAKPARGRPPGSGAPKAARKATARAKAA